jgi:hypothetical protein
MPLRSSIWRRGLAFAGLGAAAWLLALSGRARAGDEIQLYDASIAEVGQWTIQHHFNYTFNSRRGPDFPGGLDPNHALNATPEFAYGVTPWFEFGFYVPWAIGKVGQPPEQQFVSNNFKLRWLFVTPEQEKRTFWYGLNFELDFPSKYFAQTRYAMEVRPIIGWRTMESAQSAQWDLIANPIVDISWGTFGDIDFAPAVRLDRKLAEDTYIALEYYTDLGRPDHFFPFQTQQHQLFVTADFKVGEINIDFGVGYGFTSGSDRLIAKTILTYDLPVPGKSGDADKAEKPMKAPPTMRGAQRAPTSTAQLLSITDPFAGMR